MGFWNDVNEELKKAVEEGWSAMKEGARAGKLKLRIYTLHKKAESLFAEIGGMVYDMARPPWENPLSKPEILRIIDELRRIEEEKRRLEGELKAAGKKGPDGGGKKG